MGDEMTGGFENYAYTYDMHLRARDCPYIYKWRNNPKRATLYGRRCMVLARMKMNSALVRFENGQEEVISRNAIRKVAT